MGTIYILDLGRGEYWGTGDFGQGIPQGPTDNPNLACAFGTVDEAREYLAKLRDIRCGIPTGYPVAIVPHAEAAANWRAVRRDLGFR